MCYFSWILGTAFALSVAIISGIWLELRLSESHPNSNE
ncbi:MAG TPA: cytochrome bd-I oxidase subunit CydX [Legionellales bacterium]|nr:cytochrome bd-I oxidase subunit CydX [Legionellales bacterium]